MPDLPGRDALLDGGLATIRDATRGLRTWTRFREGSATRDIRDAALLAIIASTRIRLGALTAAMVEHQIAKLAGLDAWEREALRVVAFALMAGALAGLGSTEIDDEGIDAVAAEAERQRDFLANFKDQIKAGVVLLIRTGDDGKPIPNPGLLARARSYGDAPWRVAEAVVRQAMARRGYDREMRVLGGESHCRACPSLAGYWAPIGTLPAIGDTPCRGSCRCRFRYERSITAKDILPIAGPILAAG